MADGIPCAIQPKRNEAMKPRMLTVEVSVPNGG
jgi:hypothetical protein